MSAFQGTLASIRAEVISALRLTTDLDTDRVDDWVNLAYQQTVQQTGCLQQKGSANLTTQVSSYDLPSTVAWIKLLVINYSDGSISQPLKQVTLEEILQERWATVAAGTQIVKPLYALVGQNQLELWPTPTTGETMDFWYVYLPDELTDGADEPAIMEPYGSKLLTYGALVEGARFKKDPLLPDFEASYETWLARFQVWLNRREGASARTFRVRGPNRFTRWPNCSMDVPGVY